MNIPIEKAIRIPLNKIPDMGGKEILRKTKEKNRKNAEYGQKECYQAAKEIGTGLVNTLHGKVYANVHYPGGDEQFNMIFKRRN